MTATQTTSAAFSAAMTFKVQKDVLKNLRASLVFADRRFAEQGEFDAGHDTLLFVNVPDLAVSVTPLTEGTPPSARALTMGTVTIDADQYGDLVAITDIAKVKSPIEIVAIGTERLSRQASISLDQINRDVIALGGTTVLASTSTAAVRTDIESDDLATVLELRRLRTKMRKANVMPREDGFYVLFVHPNVAYDLKNQAVSAVGAFQSVNLNIESGHDALIRGEIGKIEGFRIVEVNNAPTFASDVTVYRSIAIGDMKGWGAGDLQTLRTYHVPQGGDHTDPLGQEELLGWKVSFGVAVLNNTFYFGLETAATDV